ncbi:ELWxxDGT repeat protein [Ramlibacter algicola]|uniref:ELWxxDGT repeat protein n=1 Tax=Ramlibacter algicola TaxID=2795217 RepID=A0A934URE3_9BURK|nr:ELWxxDGT repeat protein [Ramlibacter algicola]MBK0392771.1 hypothetical protein [Ramlibacter algicola]
MQSRTQWSALVRILVLAASAALAACGGGGGDDAIADAGAPATGTPSTDTTGTPGTTTNTGGGTTTTPTPAGVAQLGTQAIEPNQITVSGTRAFFIGRDGSINHNQLWVTDGTIDGTKLVREISGGSIQSVTAFSGGVFFVGSDATASGALWFSDGTNAGTKLLKDITTATSENISMVGVYGNRLYFTANDGNGRELWTSDGTAGGTYMVANINPNPAGTNPNADTTVKAGAFFNGKFYFYAWYYQPNTFTAYAQLYATTGAQGDLAQLTTNTVSDSVLLDFDMEVYKGQLYFTWQSAANGIELWRTDGTIAGTQPFFDFVPGNGNSYPSHFHVINDKLVLFAYEPGVGSQQSMWSTDGTAAGTQVVKSVDLGPNANAMVPMNGLWYFPGRALGGPNPFTLWVTDGTTAGTKEVSAVVRPDANDFERKAVVVAGNKLVFMGTDGTNGFEPWVTDGTGAGTLMLKNINPTSGSYTATVGAGYVVAHNGKAYFVAAPALNDFHLWETDGTTAGTVEVKPANATTTVNPVGQDGFGIKVPNPVPVLVNGTLVYRAQFTTTEGRLWKL